MGNSYKKALVHFNKKPSKLHFTFSFMDGQTEKSVYGIPLLLSMNH